MFMLENKQLPIDVPFKTQDGTQYPANWLRFASTEEKAAIGITEVPDAPTYDDRYYWGVNNPKDLDQCKAVRIAAAKQIAGSILAQTDWKIIRAQETGVSADEATLAYRAAVRAASNNFEAAIRDVQNVEQLAALQFVWPEA